MFKIERQQSYALSNYSQDAEVSVFIIGKDGLEERKYASLKSLQTSKDMSELMDLAEAGKIFSVEYNVTAFVDAPNANNSRPRPGTLDKVAKRSGQAPMQIDHNRSSSANIGVIKSWSVGANGGSTSLEARPSVRSKEYIVRFLKGQMTSYSVGIDPKSAYCSCCSKAYKQYGSRYFYPACDHIPGQKYDGVVCEAFFKGARAVELSATQFPAVPQSKNKTASFSDEPSADDEKPPEVEPDFDMNDLEKAKAQLAALQTEFEALKKSHESFKESAQTSFKGSVAGVLNLLASLKKITPAQAKDTAKYERLFAAMGFNEALEMIVGAGGIAPAFGSLSADPAPPEPDSKQAEVYNGAIDFFSKLGIIDSAMIPKQNKKANDSRDSSITS